MALDHLIHFPTTAAAVRAVAICPSLLVALVGVTGCGEKNRAGKDPPVAAHESGPWQTQEWPMTRGGVALQGRVRDRVPLQPVVEWTFRLKGAVTTEAVLADGVLVLGNDEGVVLAVDLATRRERWRTETRDAIEASPALAGGRVFAGSNDGTFRALDITTGRALWQIKGQEKFPTGAVALSSPDGTEAWILVNGYDGVVRCLRAKDGSEVWNYATENYINGSPAILEGGLVAFGGCDSVIHVIRLKDGSSVNKVTTDAQIIRSLATWGTTLYGVNYANQLLAVGTNDKKLTWVYEDDGAQFLTCPSVDEARVYVGSRDKHVHAVDRLSGKQAWKFKTGGRVESAPLVFEDAVVFGSHDGRLYAVNKPDGREIWRLDLGENLTNAPAFAAGRLVIGSAEGTVFVIRGGGGT
jgi:outer membrane protein assembly factor BamB